jgi:preprotein translocase subunit SecF
MVFNAATRGSVLNFGIDFAGGSAVRLALASRQDRPDPGGPQALDGAGYEGVSAVTVPDAANQVLVHVKDVASIDDGPGRACKAAVEAYPKAKLKRFNVHRGRQQDVHAVRAQPTYSELEALLDEGRLRGQGRQGHRQARRVPGRAGPHRHRREDPGRPRQAFGAGTVAEIVSSETVGAKVGNQLKNDGIKSLLYAIGFIFLYVMLRFDLRYAPGGIVALTHDAADHRRRLRPDLEGVQPPDHRRAADDHRLLDQRHDRGLRPHP